MWASQVKSLERSQSALQNEAKSQEAFSCAALVLWSLLAPNRHTFNIAPPAGPNAGQLSCPHTPAQRPSRPDARPSQQPRASQNLATVDNLQGLLSRTMKIPPT
ncbi:hypothetical protein Q8A67_018240 [Cirrhinus molitorella]|uniref:Uncharacterized protein n=1 Tax=Cirrhinus molitorella TaxID=172907 RepID=A0AA88PFZ7_9TELE|nr:hypothetical protein Q8A67_018240 [Cirrhinus molitorella]